MTTHAFSRSSGSATCPCGGLPKGAAFRDCCQPALNLQTWPATAEALMRSRYCAFATGNGDHLFRTWDPRTRPADTTPPVADWVRLEILRTEAGGADDTEGLVEFRAHCIEDREKHIIHEVSTFAKRAGRWVYVDALEASGQPAASQ
ncbi:YchJ family protein [Brevibacterium otitidis]|uniref:YchJ family protein n=1 Tax=Brevibacterium otitidis TaxID=53364 RepID=A0ABV5X200_9MICO|nr:YchJ family protein [Brevibacterium otitidis]